MSDAEEELPINPNLLAALAAARNPNTTARSKGPLQTYMATTSAVNLRELVGISRHMVLGRMLHKSCPEG